MVGGGGAVCGRGNVLAAKGFEELVFVYGDGRHGEVGVSMPGLRGVCSSPGRWGIGCWDGNASLPVRLSHRKFPQKVVRGYGWWVADGQL